MIITEIIWKDQFVEKLAWKHGVSTIEVEETLHANPHLRKVGKGNVKGETSMLRMARLRRAGI